LVRPWTWEHLAAATPEQVQERYAILEKISRIPALP